MSDPKPNKKLAPLALVAALMLAAGCGTGYFAAKKLVKPSPASGSATKVASIEKPDTIVPLGEPLIVNLADPDRRIYLKVGLQLGIQGKVSAESAALVAPIARDAAIRILSTKASDTLLTSAGRDQVKQEITAALAQSGVPVQVSHVFFTDFLVQR